MAKGKPGGAQSNRMTIQRQDQDAGKSTALLLAIVGAIIGTLFWRSRKASKEVDQGPSTSHAKGKIPSPAKTAGNRRVNKKVKGKKRKLEEKTKPAKPSWKEKAGGDDSVMYTNHRFFQNPNGAATPLSAPAAVAKPKEE